MMLSEDAAEVLMATPCTKSLGCESGGHKQRSRKSARDDVYH